MKKPGDWILAFIPATAYGQRESFRQHKFFVVASFITCLFALGYCCMSIYISGYLFAGAMIVSAALFFILPFLLRAGIRLEILANIFMGTIAVVYVLLIYWEG